MSRRDDERALLLPNRSDVQIANRFSPFVGVLDFPDHTKLVELVETLLGLTLRQILNRCPQSRALQSKNSIKVASNSVRAPMKHYGPVTIGLFSDLDWPPGILASHVATF
jgi:hypothetical protein